MKVRNKAKAPGRLVVLFQDLSYLEGDTGCLQAEFVGRAGTKQLAGQEQGNVLSFRERCG